MPNYSPDQDAALNAVLAFLQDDTKTEMAISGAAGTGKTFLTRAIIKEAHKQARLIKLLTNATDHLAVDLTSTTNKAARVLADATGSEVVTIHSLLGLSVYNDYKTGKVSLRMSRDPIELQQRLIIIDEASMINEELLSIIRQMTINCKILFIGDKYQLAPVMENSAPVFDASMEQFELTTIHRQHRNSSIIPFAQSFRNTMDTGIFPIIKSCGPSVSLITGDEFTAQIQQAFTQKHTANDYKIIAWKNKRVHEFNNYIKTEIHGSTDLFIGETVLTNKPVMEPNGRRILSTDAFTMITQIEPEMLLDIPGNLVTLDNKVRVFQPDDPARVEGLAKHYAKHKDWPKYFEIKDSFGDLRPIHASTCNKAQGSTYNTVFIDVGDIGTCTSKSDIARMMYVSVSRASHQVVMVGDLPKRLYDGNI